MVWWTLSGGPWRAGSSRCAGSCPCFQLLHCVRRKLKIHKYFPTITFPCKQFLKLPRGCYVIMNGRGKRGPWNHERGSVRQLLYQGHFILYKARLQHLRSLIKELKLQTARNTGYTCLKDYKNSRGKSYCRFGRIHYRKKLAKLKYRKYRIIFMWFMNLHIKYSILKQH